MQCSRCQVSEEERRLQICPTCKKPFCHECTVIVGGKGFCTRGCGDYFFFGDGDDDEDLDDG